MASVLSSGNLRPRRRDMMGCFAPAVDAVQPAAGLHRAQVAAHGFGRDPEPGRGLDDVNPALGFPPAGELGVPIRRCAANGGYFTAPIARPRTRRF